MKKYYDKALVEEYLANSSCEAFLRDLRDSLFVIRYERGEFVTSPMNHTELLQIVVEGTLRIYYIRDDGSSYSLANGQKDYLVGEMALFQKEPGSVYAQACDDLICLAFSIRENREKMLASCRFLQLVIASLTRKMEAITRLDAAPATLKQRVLVYMQYKCENGELKGVEQAAFRLNCSARQLQRILNQYETEGIVTKQGKGNYRMNRPLPEQTE
ncbi:Crp/Fnr family transcriptional regulator [Allofournierella sp. CML151]|uniref:Crp/Fnr family transcriptional regulator n=1 Tax=Allofournierella sp. CML151 TaxID=2998082 RepID=UPI0022EAAF2C|nr:cyclic nucleotide-binding domain-containing protein [Fournierella sp. CML151]